MTTIPISTGLDSHAQTTPYKSYQNFPFFDLKETLAVGFATFGGSVDLQAIEVNTPTHPRICGVSRGDMNKNIKILSSIAIGIRLSQTHTGDEVVVGASEKVARLTLYAARLDFKIKDYKIKKGRAFEIISSTLKELGCKFDYNGKTGMQCTTTIYDLGRAETIEEVGNYVASMLAKSGEVDGTVSPDIVKLHLTGCRREEEVRECAHVLYEILKPYGKRFVHLQTYNVMCNSTYTLRRKLRIRPLVKYLSTRMNASNASNASRMCLIHDNTRKPNKLSLLFPFDRAATEAAGVEAWRDNYEVTLTIKDNGKIDQSAFSRTYGIIVQEKLAALLREVPEEVYR